jgi:hypothetical protein
VNGQGAGAHDLSPAVRAAALSYLALGLGFGAGAVVTLSHLARTGELPMTPFGFRSMSGPFEALGPDRFAALGWALVGVCALDVVAGAWLWQGRRRGLLLGLATTAPAFGLGAGFALPFLLVGVPIRVVLVLAGRRSLQ